MLGVKKALALIMVLAALFAMAACAQWDTVASSDDEQLELDYIENENAAANAPEASKRPWYVWIKDAFSFGNVPSVDRPAAQTPSSAPDNVKEFYELGTAPDGRPQRSDNTPVPESSAAVTPFAPKPKTEKPDGKQIHEPQASITPAPVQTAEPKKDTVTMHIRCDTAVANGMHLEAKWAGIVPASGCILDTTTIEIKDGDTVLDVLKMARDKFKLHMEYSGGSGSGAYVEGINNLYEFDGGRWSGWMYCVNDWYPNYGCGVYFLKPGDRIEWNYTCDLGLDLDPTWYAGAQEWKDTHE
jgi:hypothetical protein